MPWVMALAGVTAAMTIAAAATITVASRFSMGFLHQWRRTLPSEPAVTCIGASQVRRRARVSARVADTISVSLLASSGPDLSHQGAPQRPPGDQQKPVIDTSTSVRVPIDR